VNFVKDESYGMMWYLSWSLCETNKCSVLEWKWVFKWGMTIKQVLFSIVISVGLDTTKLSLKVEIVVIKVKGDLQLILKVKLLSID